MQNIKTLRDFVATVMVDLDRISTLAGRTDSILEGEIRLYMRYLHFQGGHIMALIDRDIGKIHVEGEGLTAKLVLECAQGQKERCCQDCAKRH